MNTKLKASKTYCCAVELDYLLERQQKGVLLLANPDGSPATMEQVTAIVNELKSKGYKYYPCEHADKTGRCQGVPN